MDCFAISPFGHADVGFAQAPRRLVVRRPDVIVRTADETRDALETR